MVFVPKLRYWDTEILKDESDFVFAFSSVKSFNQSWSRKNVVLYSMK